MRNQYSDLLEQIKVFVFISLDIPNNYTIF